ncbi:hypothetical protein PoB_001563000 [Plakobranchus ocellatus]|uniref:Uncharacterized protein n=1 Tax=Plakobranchus ocellatus TaxID=259542 RepID=A0AAV3Z3D5_9GAST|nr:hypothetical protein PoB_001563000 [Plakobranchus ocellatus]
MRQKFSQKRRVILAWKCKKQWKGIKIGCGQACVTGKCPASRTSLWNDDFLFLITSLTNWLETKHLQCLNQTLCRRFVSKTSRLLLKADTTRARNPEFIL